MEEYENPVFLRPRRFGKSLWCSILNNYYDINKKEQFETLFGDTEIGQNPTATKNSYMILHLDFSVIDVTDDIDEIEHEFNNHCNHVLKTLLTTNKDIFTDIYTIDTKEKASFNLNIILQEILANKLPPIYIIIDEYDNFSNQLVTNYHQSLYQKLTSDDGFFKTFFKVLKAGRGSGAIANVFITGVLLSP